MAIGDKKPVVMEYDRAVPGGVATLGRDGKLEESQRPDIDNKPVEDSDNPVKSGGVFSALQLKTNPNILINWYLVGGGSQQGGGQFPINQRGETEYARDGYTIDMWRISGSKDSKITLSASYLSLVSGAVNVAFRHKFERLPAGTYTLSVLCTDGLFAGTVKWDGSTSVKAVDLKDFSILLELHSGVQTFTIRIDTPSTQKDLIAAKLELGPVQTLAHKEGDTWVLNDPPPNFQQELEKCQRYQLDLINSELTGDQIIGIGVGRTTDYAYIYVSTPVSMRAKPTISLRAGDFLLTPDGSNENGIVVTDISVSDVSNNIVSLGVSASGLTVGKTYVLACKSDAVNKRHLLLDANL